MIWEFINEKPDLDNFLERVWKSTARRILVSKDESPREMTAINTMKEVLGEVGDKWADRWKQMLFDKKRSSDLHKNFQQQLEKQAREQGNFGKITQWLGISTAPLKIEEARKLSILFQTDSKDGGRVWPGSCMSKEFDVSKLPTEVRAMISAYLAFAKNETKTDYKYLFQVQHGLADVNVNYSVPGGNRKHLLTLTSIQMLACLFFNNKSQYTVEELVEASGIIESLLTPALEKVGGEGWSFAGNLIPFPQLSTGTDATRILNKDGEKYVVNYSFNPPADFKGFRGKN